MKYLSIAWVVALPLALAENITSSGGGSYITATFPSTSFAGPFELDEAYPVLYGGVLASTAMQDNSNLLFPKPVRVNTASTAPWKAAGTSIPIYLIYYGPPNSYTSSRKAIFDSFVSGIPSTPLWTTVTNYTFNGVKAGTPNLAQSIFVDCSKTVAEGGYATSQRCAIYDTIDKKNNVNRYGWRELYANLRNGGLLPVDSNALYTLILDEAVDYAVDTINSDGTHSYEYIGTFSCSVIQGGTLYDYTEKTRQDAITPIVTGIVQVPNNKAISSYHGRSKPISKCLISPNNRLVSPNGDPGADAAVNFILHELVEAMLGAPQISSNGFMDNQPSVLTYADADGQTPVDKCTQLWPLIQTSKKDGTDTNYQVGTRRYLINPLWSITSQKCVLP